MKANCKVCGAEVDRPPAHMARTPNGVFCSHVCHGIWQTGENNHAYQGGKVSRSCEICSAQFRVSPHRVRRGYGRFCSKECQGIGRKRGPHKVVILKCEMCGIQVEKPPSHVNAHNYCSKLCANKAHSKRMSREGNPRFVHGMSPERYSALFRQMAPLVKERDKQACRKCGMTRVEHGKELDVHHINYDKDDNCMGNLVCLCRWCHGAMHGGPDSRADWTAFWLNQLSPTKHPSTSTTLA